jgi:hypothetical protein
MLVAVPCHVDHAAARAGVPQQLRARTKFAAAGDVGGDSARAPGDGGGAGRSQVAVVVEGEMEATGEVGLIAFISTPRSTVFKRGESYSSPETDCTWSFAP